VVSEVSILVTVLNADGKTAFARCYTLLDNPYGVQPYQASVLKARFGYELLPGQRWQWFILSARGRHVHSGTPDWHGDIWEYMAAQQRDEANHRQGEAK
jgi:hypothetical protein